MGTPDYIAPEQARDAHSADIRADIYSLGCTLYFLLTGRPPFAADNVLMKLKAHTQEPPSSLTTLRKDVPAELSKVVARMMAKNPVERFQTPAEVAYALAPFARTKVKLRRTQPFRSVPWLVSFFTALVLIAAVVFYIQTDYGLVRVEIHDPNAQVQLRCDRNDVVKIKSYDLTLRVRSGPGSLFIKHGDIEFETDKFTVRRGDNLSVVVERVEGTIQARLGQAVIGARKLNVNQTSPPPIESEPPTHRAGLLTNPPKLPPGGLPVGKNLIIDPSLEETSTGSLPQGWFAVAR